MQPQRSVHFSLTNSQLSKVTNKENKRSASNTQRYSKRSKLEAEKTNENKTPQVFPEDVFKIIHDSIKSGLEALSSPSWNNFFDKKNTKPSIFSLFNSRTGEIYIVPPQEFVALPRNVIPVEFEFQSKTKVSLKRDEFRKSLIESKNRLSMTAVKILFAVEKLLGECHSFESEECSLQETSETQDGASNVKSWTLYKGNLEKGKIKTLLDNQQKIKEVWEEIHQSHTGFDKKFLLNLPYQRNESDKGWEPSELIEGEILVVKRNNKEPTFALKQVMDPKNAKNNEIQIYLGDKVKNLSLETLSTNVVARW